MGLGRKQPIEQQGKDRTPKKMRIFVCGAGSQGRVVLDLLREQSPSSEFFFIDDDRATWGLNINGASVLGGLNFLDKEKECSDLQVAVAIGHPLWRRKVYAKLLALDLPLLNVCHHSSYIAKSASIGKANTIAAGVIVNTNTLVEDLALINNKAVIEHDCHIKTAATVCPGAQIGGRVVLEEDSFVATGAIVLARRRIGKGAIVAAGSIVTEDVPDNSFVRGQPARLIENTDMEALWKRVF